MKVNVIGFEITQGVSKKNGQPYAIGKLHCALPLAPSQGQGNCARGYMGSTYQLDVSVLRKVEHLAPPFNAEIDVQDVMRFGERRQEIAAISPLQPDRKAA